MRGLRYSGRMGWFSLAELYVLVCIAAFGIALFQVSQQFSQRRVLWVLGVLIFSAILGIFLFQNSEAHMAVFNRMLENKLIFDVDGIKTATNFLNSFGNAAMFALLSGICTVLLPVPLAPYPAGLKQLSRKMKSLRTMLYAGTALLVVTMLLKDAVFQWALAYTSQSDAALGIARSLITSLMSIDGTFYTLILAAAYVPAWLILQRRARLLPDLPTDELEVEKKLQEYGITFTIAKSIPRVLAIFAPILAGPLGDLINGLLF